MVLRDQQWHDAAREAIRQSTHPRAENRQDIVRGRVSPEKDHRPRGARRVLAVALSHPLLFCFCGSLAQNLREESGVHTCDQRLPRSKILESLGPSELLRFEIEEGMTEADEFWDPDVRETRAHVASRARSVLDKIFREQTDKTCMYNTFFSGHRPSSPAWTVP